MRRAAAFSLLETVLALGIASTVLVAAMGLIPLGLRNAHDAEQQAAEARIIQSFRDRRVAGLRQETFYFSSNGSLLSGKSGDAVYTATVQPGRGVSLPGNSDKALSSVIIEIRDLTPASLSTRNLVLPP